MVTPARRCAVRSGQFGLWSPQRPALVAQATSPQELAPVFVGRIQRGALDLHPGTAWPAPVVRRQALREDAFKAEFFGVLQQQRAIRKRLYQA